MDLTAMTDSDVTSRVGSMVRIRDAWPGASTCWLLQGGPAAVAAHPTNIELRYQAVLALVHTEATAQAVALDPRISRRWWPSRARAARRRRRTASASAKDRSLLPSATASGDAVVGCEEPVAKGDGEGVQGLATVLVTAPAHRAAVERSRRRSPSGGREEPETVGVGVAPVRLDVALVGAEVGSGNSKRGELRITVQPGGSANFAAP